VLLRIAAAALLAVALAACGGKKQAQPKSQLPPGCTVPEVEQVVNGFLATPSFAPAGQFDVYASYDSDKRTFISHSPAKALAHLSARRALGERDRLLSLRVAPQDFNHARITFTLTRFAPDFLGRGIHTRLAQGAGTVDCAHGKIAAWVMKGP
jgi:hypothetical protein